MYVGVGVMLGSMCPCVIYVPMCEALHVVEAGCAVGACWLDHGCCTGCPNTEDCVLLWGRRGTGWLGKAQFAGQLCTNLAVEHRSESVYAAALTQLSPSVDWADTQPLHLQHNACEQCHQRTLLISQLPYTPCPPSARCRLCTSPVSPEHHAAAGRE